MNTRFFILLFLAFFVGELFASNTPVYRGVPTKDQKWDYQYILRGEWPNMEGSVLKKDGSGKWIELSKLKIVDRKPDTIRFRAPDGSIDSGWIFYRFEQTKSSFKVRLTGDYWDSAFIVIQFLQVAEPGAAANGGPAREFASRDDSQSP